ncbi:ornithine cyclodeaminase family protein [Sphingomonas sp. MG17]|uniref:Ornithine cyclodeaminase family protein n=1 Tax=Sphingomonas tagetis TaxID=2949092 RepID=A0A9X2HMB7_9SPHN|nr:ornithine cyclodeaminase family protein [Sphingomonas tagetis]MCP3729963.1 ornithine cyclodeaminase family protein [Sphingomonas tagetis]
MSLPRVIDGETARAALGFPELIAALRSAFAEGAVVPPRHHHEIESPGGPAATLLLMPAWQEGGLLGVKIATIHPGNGALGLPGVHASYLLAEAATGRPLALIDGDAITARRTIAASALAADHCARPDARTLLVVGAGRVASLAAEAFAAVRPIERVRIWNPTAAKAEALAVELAAQGFDAAATGDLARAAGEADIVTCATLSTTPLIRGEWLRPGAHLDLIGSFTPGMREADDACFAEARVFVDAREALDESGDLLGPIASGVFAATRLAGTLADLCTGRVAGRVTLGERTIFKAVGTALADLAAAALIYRAMT